jgi:hypothetical protein
MRRTRHHEVYDPVIISREVSRDFSRHTSQRESSFDERETVAEVDPVFVPESSFEAQAVPATYQESGNNLHDADVISLDAMRSGSSSYQGEDLDIPAFLRKRSEVM